MEVSTPKCFVLPYTPFSPETEWEKVKIKMIQIRK